ncbi:MAG TPA: cytochrome c [Cryptosporangiaceae bacterium]|nr:cytochrome c [Cryptosporangiaceae bacterium]
MMAAALVGARSRLRRVPGFVVLLLALVLVGGVYTVFAPTGYAEELAVPDPAKVAEGERLYLEGCISCHGRNAQGVTDRGPSLIGVGPASVEFQVSTGRMPAARQEAQITRKTPKYSEEETEAMAAYIQSLGGGPEIPEGDLRAGDPAKGGELYRLNCASCHSYGLNGGALSSGKYAPSLEPATDRDLYAAMLTGPQNMPVFGDTQLTPQEKRDIIAFVQSVKNEPDPGGLGLGRTGPVPEGLVVFLVGMSALLFGTLWVAGKS